MDEAAINVVYNFDTEEDSKGWHIPRSPSDAAGDTPGGYNLRPMRGQQLPRAGKRQAPYSPPSVSPSPPVAVNAHDRPYSRGISAKGKERADVSSTAASSSSRSSASGAKDAAVICISSDSSGEDEEGEEDDGVPPAEKSPVRVYKVARTRSPTPASDREESLVESLLDRRRSHKAKNTWYKPSDNRMIQPAPQNGEPPRPPDALIDGLRAMREDYRRDAFNLGYNILPDGQIKWGIRCQTCPDAPLLSAPNAGLTIYNFKAHLDSPKRHRTHPPTRGRKRRKLSAAVEHPRPRARASPAPLPVVDVPLRAGGAAASSHQRTVTPAMHCPPRSSASSSTTIVGSSRPGPSSSSARGSAAPSQLKDDAADVEDFLHGIGLSAELASALRGVGVSDRARMRALGGLPDAELDKLDRCLARAGLDDAARILVRCGLRKCAAA
ncbi:hypothetical protein FKP32DRAFT_1755333 [Trametes sanguinea]|nr:hypothetical protein FKP32DRAFT_1755333 [Trametes sanguinea]